MAVTDVQNTTMVRGDYRLLRNKSGTPVATGIGVKKLITAIFDTSKNDSSGTANTAVGTHGLGIYLPPKAVVVRAWFQTVTGFTSGTSTATIAMQAEAAADLYAATLVSNAALSGAAFTDGKPSGAASAFVQASVERELKVVVAVEALTAGKFVLYVEFVQGS